MNSRECKPLHTPAWHRASSLEDQESVGVVHFEVQYACAQLTSLTLDVTHVIPSRFSMSRGSKVARIKNAYSLGTRLGHLYILSTTVLSDMQHKLTDQVSAFAY